MVTQAATHCLWLAIQYAKIFKLVNIWYVCIIIGKPHDSQSQRLEETLLM